MRASAGLRGPGKYSGVVVFDRWDTCFLLSGPYITYVSSRVKEDLRPYRGKPMQVDAKDVWQPANPGDALIRQYEVLGPAPKPQWRVLDGLELIATPDFGFAAKPTFIIEIHNFGASSLKVDVSEVAPVLLSGDPNPRDFGPSDDVSLAVITRSELGFPPRNEVSPGDRVYSWSYFTDPQVPPRERIELVSGQSFKTRITFQVITGHYQFMFGYGGGVHEEESLASNAISFDVDELGVAEIRN
jgi:hypothetical protein